VRDLASWTRRLGKLVRSLVATLLGMRYSEMLSLKADG